MRFSWGRRSARTVAVGILAAGGLVCVTGTADAYAATRVPLGTSHGVGVYASATSAARKVGTDVLPGYGNVVWAMCWQVGQSIGNFSDGTAWTFAPYVDGAAAFHNGLPQCPRSTLS